MPDQETKSGSSARVQIIVALIGLTGVIATALIANWNNIFPRKPAPSAPAITSATSSGTGEPRKSEHPVHSSGRLTVRGTYTCDLDNGTETRAGADFQWDQVDQMTRFLAPMNGASFYVVGARDFESIRWSEMERFPYSTTRIDASQNANNRIPAGTVVAYRTNENRLGKFIVDESSYNLTIRWRTYD